MASYNYIAVDPGGSEKRGTIDVSDQSEALRRIREMGFFPTRLSEDKAQHSSPPLHHVTRSTAGAGRFSLAVPGKRIGSRPLAVFTRQLATLIEAGMPLLRGLRVLHEQEENPTLRRIIEELAVAIENGGSLSEALELHPRSFNRLYVNMVKAGEVGGALELTLRRLSEFMEKGQRIKGKVKAALFYPIAVLVVAIGILGVMMVFVVPRFSEVFEGLLQGAPMPAFTPVRPGIERRD